MQASSVGLIYQTLSSLVAQIESLRLTVEKLLDVTVLQHNGSFLCQCKVRCGKIPLALFVLVRGSTVAWSAKVCGVRQIWGVCVQVIQSTC